MKPVETKGARQEGGLELITEVGLVPAVSLTLEHTETNTQDCPLAEE